MEPAYKKVYDILRRRISEEEYPVGSNLPTEPMLEEQFSVSRTTVRKAVAMLAEDGFVRAKQGRGTEVIANKATQQLNQVTSISETLQNMGYKLTQEYISLNMEKAAGRTAQNLQLPENTPLAVVTRVNAADGQPITLMENTIAYKKVPGIENHTDKMKFFYAYLEDYHNIEITSAVDAITAEAAGDYEAKMLQVPKGTALLVLRRITYHDDVPVTQDYTKIPGHMYEFTIRLTGRQK